MPPHDQTPRSSTVATLLPEATVVYSNAQDKGIDGSASLNIDPDSPKPEKWKSVISL